MTWFSPSWQISKSKLYKTHREDLKTHQEFFNKMNPPLNLSQKLALLHDTQRVLVLAGAGTGKTSLLLAKIQWIIETQRAEPNEILLLSFTRAAAGEARERLKKKGGWPVEVLTFHSLALRWMSELGDKTELKVSNDEEHPETWWEHQFTETLFEDPGFREFLKTNKMGILNPIEFTRIAKSLYSLQLNVYSLEIKDWPRHFRNPLEGSFEFWYLSWFRLCEKHRLKNKWRVYDHALMDTMTEIQKGTIENSYKYIMVDEFQDISPLRMQWLQCLVNANPKVKLICVGDDWQSIYRFTGSQVDYLTQFPSFFKGGEALQLDETFRFHKHLETLSRRFVLKNPAQLKKKMFCHRQFKERSVIVSPVRSIDSGWDQILSEIKSQTQNSAPKNTVPQHQIEVMLIARNRSHLPAPWWLQRFKKKFPELKIKALTAHSSKGLEADYVILYAPRGRSGFPNQMGDEEYLKPWLAQGEDYLHAEERRLFYVALTRARLQVYILEGFGKSSIFTEELIQESPEFMGRRVE